MLLDYSVHTQQKIQHIIFLFGLLNLAESKNRTKKKPLFESFQNYVRSVFVKIFFLHIISDTL